MFCDGCVTICDGLVTFRTAAAGRRRRWIGLVGGLVIGPFDFVTICDELAPGVFSLALSMRARSLLVAARGLLRFDEVAQHQRAVVLLDDASRQPCVERQLSDSDRHPQPRRSALASRPSASRPRTVLTR